MWVVIVGASGNVGTALLRRLSDEPDVTVSAVARRNLRCGTEGPTRGRVVAGDWRGGVVLQPDMPVGPKWPERFPPVVW
jgi:UDP-glucose 4-epimerase